MAHKISKTFTGVATGIIGLGLVTIGVMAGVVTYVRFASSEGMGDALGVTAGVIAGLIAAMPFWVASLVVKYRI